MATIADNLQQVHARIARACAAARRPVQSVTLLAVSKTFGAEAVREAHRGRASAASARTTCRKAWTRSPRWPTCATRIEWHLIGPLQSNKTRVVAEHFDWVHIGGPAEDRAAPERAAARRTWRRCRCACRSTSAARPARAGSRRSAGLAARRGAARRAWILSSDYGDDPRQHTTSARSHGGCVRRRTAARAKRHAAVREQDLRRRRGARGAVRPASAASARTTCRRALDKIAALGRSARAASSGT